MELADHETSVEKRNAIEGFYAVSEWAKRQAYIKSHIAIVQKALSHKANVQARNFHVSSDQLLITH